MQFSFIKSCRIIIVGVSNPCTVYINKRRVLCSCLSANNLSTLTLCPWILDTFNLYDTFSYRLLSYIQAWSVQHARHFNLFSLVSIYSVGPSTTQSFIGAVLRDSGFTLQFYMRFLGYCCLLFACCFVPCPCKFVFRFISLYSIGRFRLSVPKLIHGHFKHLE